ncbi:unnamed protein product [Candida verbasci]|uniref:Uncharacterized protein n=1 Tax=Candida verbasci TaxID=1227364 RepID=A0A9W4TXR0_9ASCO|nr:unnamed protein product [Candida verbasci]
MSKRYSFIGKSPKSSQDPTFDTPINPYEVVNQKNQSYYQNSNQQQPKVIINEDPILPNYTKIQMSTKKRANYNMKIVVVGDGAVGKSCLLVSYAESKFPEIYVPTVFENYVTIVQSPYGKTIELALWDTAGQEEYDRLRPLSYPDTDLILLCFSLNNLTSLQNVKDLWYPELNHFCPDIPIILVGTKQDLYYGEIDNDLPIQVAKEIGAIGYIQCSAKTMFNIRTVFNFALNHFQKEMELQEQVEKSQQSSKKRLSRVLGSSSDGAKYAMGHTRNQSSLSNKRRGHLKNTSYDSTILLDQPLTEDNYVKNPYGDFGSNNNSGRNTNGNSTPNPNIYKEEFDFIRDREKKKKKKCVIL